MNGPSATDLPAMLQVAPKDLFFYGVSFATQDGGASLTLAASAILQAQTFQIEQDSAYIICGINRFYTSSADAVIATNMAPVLCMIQDSGSGRNLMNRPVALDTIAGLAGGGPGGVIMQYPFPKLIGPNSVVTVQLTNLLATAINVRITFWGYKVYRSVNMQPALAGF